MEKIRKIEVTIPLKTMKRNGTTSIQVPFSIKRFYRSYVFEKLNYQWTGTKKFLEVQEAEVNVPQTKASLLRSEQLLSHGYFNTSTF